MEKRVLLAISLSFLVLFAYQMFVPKPAPKPGAVRPGVAAGAANAGTTGSSSAQTAGQTGSGSGSTGSQNGIALEQDSPKAAATDANAHIADTAEREIVVDTNHVHAVFSNRGAVLKAWTLKHYLDDQGKPIDILPALTSKPDQRPFAVSVPDNGVTQEIQTALYKPSATSLQLGDTSQKLRFDYEDSNGVAVHKEFEFQPDGKLYVVRLNVTVTQKGQPLKVTVHGGAGLGDLARAEKPAGFFHPSNYQRPEAIFQQGTDVKRVAVEKIPQQPVHEGDFHYVGVDDHYFLGAYLADLSGNPSTRVEYAPVPVTTSTGPRDLVDYRITPTGNTNAPLTFFYGPKDFDILKSTDPELVRSIYFGMFSFLAVPLLRALKWINAYVGNFGWSIILLTVCINLVLFPLRHKSVVSMRRMQEIQPQVKAIQDRYAKLKVTDPARQKMNTELMSLYKEKGVNPASGCVPMLLTLPVLFAFYALLSVAIELRGAPFTLWIHDLSRYDPYFVTPILMGITQFWQTRLTPTTGDPAQQKMMMFMPLMFMVFFVWAPSGLVIYWFVSNLWSIGQQYLTNQLIGPPPQQRAANRRRPAA